jgi:hypothetical protein
MAERKPFIGDLKVDDDLQGLLNETKRTPITDNEIKEQRISFAYGNAPVSAKGITKDSVRRASEHTLLKT